MVSTTHFATPTVLYLQPSLPKKAFAGLHMHAEHVCRVSQLTIVEESRNDRQASDDLLLSRLHTASVCARGSL